MTARTASRTVVRTDARGVDLIQWAVLRDERARLERALTETKSALEAIEGAVGLEAVAALGDVVCEACARPVLVLPSGCECGSMRVVVLTTPRERRRWAAKRRRWALLFEQLEILPIPEPDAAVLTIVGDAP